MKPAGTYADDDEAVREIRPNFELKNVASSYTGCPPPTTGVIGKAAADCYTHHAVHGIR